MPPTRPPKFTSDDWKTVEELENAMWETGSDCYSDDGKNKLGALLRRIMERIEPKSPKCETLIKYFGQEMRIGCDGNCQKAWGISSRPRVSLSNNEDDFEYKTDDELGDVRTT